MLDRLSQAAGRLRPLAPALAIVSTVLFAVAAAITVSTTSERADAWLLPVLTLLVWTVCALVFTLAFTSVPPAPGPDLRGTERLRVQLNRLFHWLLALVFAGTAFAALSLTEKLLGDWWP